MPVAAAWAAVAVALGSAAYSGVSSADASDKADKKMKEQEQSARKLQKDYDDTQSNLEKSTAGKDARDRQKKLAAGATGRGDTLLTGPSGDAGDVPGAKKTLLGL